jgi:hypothetical protein
MPSLTELMKNLFIGEDTLVWPERKPEPKPPEPDGDEDSETWSPDSEPEESSGKPKKPRKRVTIAPIAKERTIIGEEPAAETPLPAGERHAVAGLLESIQALSSQPPEGQTDFALNANLGPVGFAIVARHLPILVGLRNLDLSGNRIGPSGAAHLSTFLKLHKTIDFLDLSGNGIGSIGAEHLVRGLLPSKALRTLDLSDNDLGDSGVLALIPALRTCRLLQLSLRNNGISEIGVWEELAEFLSGDPKLEVLELSENGLGDAGATVLASSLSGNKTLRHLILRKCRIGNAGAKALAGHLSRNTELWVLNLAGNRDMKDEGAVAFAGLIAKNTSLRFLDLSYSGMHAAPGGTAIVEALRENVMLEGLLIHNHAMSTSALKEIRTRLRKSKAARKASGIEEKVLTVSSRRPSALGPTYTAPQPSAPPQPSLPAIATFKSIRHLGNTSAHKASSYGYASWKAFYEHHSGPSVDTCPCINKHSERHALTPGNTAGAHVAIELENGGILFAIVLCCRTCMNLGMAFAEEEEVSVVTLAAFGELGEGRTVQGLWNGVGGGSPRDVALVRLRPGKMVVPARAA